MYMCVYMYMYIYNRTMLIRHPSTADIHYHYNSLSQAKIQTKSVDDKAIYVHVAN